MIVGFFSSTAYRDTFIEVFKTFIFIKNVIKRLWIIKTDFPVIWNFYITVYPKLNQYLSIGFQSFAYLASYYFIPLT